MNDKSKDETLIKSAKQPLLPAYVTVFTVLKALADGAIGSQDAVEKNIQKATSNSEIEIELGRQEALLIIFEGRARIARELAIARRIDTAEEVEVEEYYDSSREGKGGLHVSDSGVGFGGSGSGKHVQKKVYRFKGWREGSYEPLLEEIQKMTPEELKAFKSVADGAADQDSK